MRWRKWLVRSLVFSVLGGLAVAGYLYQRWTDPAVVRRQLVAKLTQLFPGAEVTLDSARLQLLGGIILGELRLSRRGDPDRAEFAYFPAAVLYHDKEQLLQGTLAIRKVELQRPRLRIVRGRDGRWNLSGLTSGAPSGLPLPTIVVRHGTILLEDTLANPGSPPLEIHDVNLNLLTDPPATVTVAGSGRSELTGPVQLRGSWDRTTGALSLSVRAAAVPVAPPLARCLAAYVPGAGEHVRYLEGVGKLQAELRYTPGAASPWSHDVHWDLSRGKLVHPLLPVPLDHLEVGLRCLDGQLTLSRFSAQAGRAALHLNRCQVHRTGSDIAFEVQGQVEHLPVGDELCSRLPETLQKYPALFKPAGPLTVAFDLCRRDGRWLRQRWALHPEGMTASCACFPCPLERMTGTLEVDFLTRRTRVDLTAFRGQRPIKIQGHWQASGIDADVKLDAQADDLPLDRALLDALPPSYRQLAESFHLGGLGDFTIKIRHSPGSYAFANQYLVKVHHGTLKWDEFPYPLQDVSGVLDIQPHHWEFRDFRGVRQGGEFRARGRSYPPPPGEPAADARVAVDISGSNVRLDDDMRNALVPFPGMFKTWGNFMPAGRINFLAKIDRLPKQPQDLDILVDVHGCTVNPFFFRYPLHDVSGRFRYCKGLLQLTGVSARHADSLVQLPRGEVKLCPGGGLYADLTDLQANPLVLDAAFQNALPLALKKAVAALQLRDRLALKTRVVIALAGEPGSLPDVYWNGTLWLHDASIRAGVPIEHVTGSLGCVGRYNGRQLLGIDGNIMLEKATLGNQPFHDVHVKIDVAEEAPDVIVLGLKAPVFGGQISGPGRIELTSTLRYELDLTASEIQLDALGRQNIGVGSQLSGVAGARLHLSGKGTGLASLEGNGSVDIPRGRLYNLPLMLDLLKFLGLRWPDRTAFEQAHAAFGIHGDKVHFNQLELFGNVISLHGQGDMRLDGSDIRLDFIPVWGRIEQVLPPVWQPLPSAIGKNLLKIEMRGKVKDLQFHKKPIPGLVEPLLQMRDQINRLRGDQVTR